MKGKNKKGMEIEMLIWMIIAIVILVIMVVAYMVLRGKGINALDYMKNLFRFGS